MEKMFVYLDDVRTPKDPRWVVLRNYEEFVLFFKTTPLESVEIISFDHDLGPAAMRQYFDSVIVNFQLDYSKLGDEKTGYDAARWLIDHALDTQQNIPQRVYSHSANPIGAANIIGLLNSYFAMHRLPQTAERIRIDHTIDNNQIFLK